MKTCILITSHLNNQAKIDVAHQQLDFLQNKGYTIIYAGNYAIPTSIQDRVDYILFTKENPMPNRGVIGWNWIPPRVGIGDNQYCMTGYPDYGYAHLLQTYRGFQFAKSLEYGYVIHLNYDITFEDAEWDKLKEEIKTNNNLTFKFGGYTATNKYMFKTDDFISLMDKTLPFYKAGNPPGIDKDWFCEVFFKWALDRENTPHQTITTIRMKDLISNQTNYSSYGNFGVYHFREKDQILLRFTTFIRDTPQITFTLNNEEDIIFQQTPDERYFLGPAKEGEYFDNGNLLFKLDKSLKERQWVERR